MKQRCEVIAEYMLRKQCTIRDAAKEFGISKSHVHTLITKKLVHQNDELYEKVRELMDENWRNKHIRGGKSTKEKYTGVRFGSRKKKKN